MRLKTYLKIQIKEPNMNEFHLNSNQFKKKFFSYSNRIRFNSNRILLIYSNMWLNINLFEKIIVHFSLCIIVTNVVFQKKTC